MKRLSNILPFLLLSGLCSAQFINDGGNVTIKPGAVLFVETDLVNNTVGPSTGTITVEGTLEIQGDLTNNATMTTAVGSLITFSGDANSNFKSGGTVVENLKMDKDHATTGTVTLVDPLSIKTNLLFDPATNANKMIIGANDLFLTDQATTITTPSPNDYIVAEAGGMVQKETNADGNFLFPVGDATDYSPIDVNYVSGTTTYTAANLRVNVDDIKHPNVPADADDYIERIWNVNETGIGGYSATLTGTYAASDVMGGSSTDVMGASQADGAVGMTVADWTFSGSDNAANQVIGSVTTSSTDFTGFNFFGKADLKVFLAGAYSGGSMTTTLSGLGSFPTTTPYTAAPFNAPSETLPGAIPAGTTDWILIEARDAMAPTTVLSQKSALLKSDGSIVGLDGGTLYMKDADPTSIMAIRHRNHLGVRTSAGYNTITGSPFDYTLGTGVYTNGSLSNANMDDDGGTKLMWAGDVNADGKVRYLASFFPPVPSDAVTILTLGLSGNPSGSLSSVYSQYDVNFDSNVRYLASFFPPVPSDAVYILTNTLVGNPSTEIQQHN